VDKVVRYDWAEMGFCGCVMSRHHMHNLFPELQMRRTIDEGPNSC